MSTAVTWTKYVPAGVPVSPTLNSNVPSVEPADVDKDLLPDFVTVCPFSSVIFTLYSAPVASAFVKALRLSETVPPVAEPVVK